MQIFSRAASAFHRNADVLDDAREGLRVGMDERAQRVGSAAAHRVESAFTAAACTTFTCARAMPLQMNVPSPEWTPAFAGATSLVLF